MSHTPSAGLSRAVLPRLFTRRLVALVGAFGLSIAVAVLLATGYHFHHARTQVLAASQESARNTTRALADTVARTIQSVDVALASVAELLAERAFAPDDPLITGALYQRLGFAPYLRQIAVVDAGGRVIYNTAPDTTQRVDLSALFPGLAGTVRPLVIGASQPGRYIGMAGGAGQRFIPLGRVVRDRDGVLLGVVVATANPLYFEDIFDAIELGAEAKLRLWLFDGRFLAGDQPRDAKAGARLLGRLHSAEFSTFVDAEDEGNIVSYRTTLNWPVVVSVSIPLDTALAQWRQEVFVVGLPVALVGLVVLGLTGVLVRSLLQRARHEEALRLSDRVLAGISNGVSIVDATAPDNPVVYANAAFERITGYTMAEVLGRNLRFLHRQAPDQPGLAVIRQALATGGEATAVLCNQRADGTLFWNELTVSAVRDHAGHVTHYVGVQRDITEKKQAEEQLRKAYDDIARFNHDLERFAFVLAHHLQEPARLQAVFSEQLVRLLPQPLPAEQAECLGHIRRGARQLSALLHDVETYITLDPASVAGTCSADAALEAALRPVAGRLADLAGHVERKPLGAVACTELRLTQVFRQLLDNAIKYRDPTRPLRVTVEATSDNGVVTIHVADNGIGIDPDYLTRIFEVFERLHTHDEHDGTGMGLALANRIIELAGGRIWATSEPGKGTTLHAALHRVQA